MGSFIQIWSLQKYYLVYRNVDTSCGVDAILFDAVCTKSQCEHTDSFRPSGCPHVRDDTARISNKYVLLGGDGLFLVVFGEYLVRFVSPNRRAILHKVHIELCTNSSQVDEGLHYK